MLIFISPDYKIFITAVKNFLLTSINTFITQIFIQTNSSNKNAEKYSLTASREEKFKRKPFPTFFMVAFKTVIWQICTNFSLTETCLITIRAPNYFTSLTSEVSREFLIFPIQFVVAFNDTRKGRNTSRYVLL